MNLIDFEDERFPGLKKLWEEEGEEPCRRTERLHYSDDRYSLEDAAERAEQDRCFDEDNFYEWEREKTYKYCLWY